MILVTGANGLIGSNILNTLVNLNFKVKGLVRNNSDLSLLSDLSKENLIHGDVLDTEDLETAFEGVDTVIHTAAVVSFDRKDTKIMEEVNVVGTRNMVDLSLQKNISYFIHVSSVAALGRAVGDKIVSENFKWEKDYSGLYGETKFYGELEVWRAHMEGLPTLILNPSTALGPGNWNKSSTQLFKYVWNENKYYSEGLLNYIDLRDLSDIVVHFLAAKTSGEKFIVSGGHVKYSDFFNKVSENFSVKPPSRKITPLKADMAVWLANIKSYFSGNRPFITREVAKKSLSSIIYDNSKLKNTLKFSFRTLDDTLDWACSDLLKKNFINS